MRNCALNARNFFDASVGHLAYNYFGGNIGGPIKKNKIFIFGDFLRVTDHEANTNLGTIPPSSWRGGNLSSGLTLATPRAGLRSGHRQSGRHQPHAVRRQHHSHQPHQPDRAEDPEPGAGAEPVSERLRPEQQLFRPASLHQGHQLVRREGGRRRLRQGPSQRALQLRPPGHLPGAGIRRGRRLRARRIPGHQRAEDVQHGRELQPHLLAHLDQRVPRRRGALSQRRAADRLRHHRFQGRRHSGRQYRCLDQRPGQHPAQRPFQQPDGGLYGQPAVAPRGSQHQRGQ